jgi:aspartokinase-like uncharacterized kinase
MTDIQESMRWLAVKVGRIHIDDFNQKLSDQESDFKSQNEAVAALERYAELLEQCAPYLKDGETPAQRIKRDHEDSLLLMEQLGREKGITELAYGWLWHVNSDDKRVHAARKVLLSGISKLGQAAGINRAKKEGAYI